ncbi:MAG TPA: hypothetical protein PKJ77_08965 [Thermodesulfobacteriota bacterium]|nr:hypothetical protein [Thermodesulfobacteriota bacterium]HNU70310.1 hypothetical protein [Thermodesulfobacteriota bacterium]HOC39396.1 hypothetical protein [Thermodesulfobacteriota bacterium]
MKDGGRDMPIDVYECSQCKEVFEIVQLDCQEPIEPRCPKCQAGNPTRLQSLFNCVADPDAPEGIGIT